MTLRQARAGRKQNGRAAERARAIDVIEALVNQFSYGPGYDGKKKYDYYSGGLSALEGAFSYLIDAGSAEGSTLVINLLKERKRAPNKK